MELKFLSQDPATNEDVYQFRVNMVHFINKGSNEIVKEIIKMVSEKVAAECHKHFIDKIMASSDVLNAISSKLAEELFPKVIEKISVQGVANIASIESGKIIGKSIS